MTNATKDSAARWRDVGQDMADEIFAILGADLDRAISQRWRGALHAAIDLLQDQRAQAVSPSPGPGDRVEALVDAILDDDDSWAADVARVRAFEAQVRAEEREACARAAGSHAFARSRNASERALSLTEICEMNAATAVADAIRRTGQPDRGEGADRGS